VSDWLWSTAVYALALVALAGVIGVIWPLHWPHRRSRRRALVMTLTPIALAFAITRITPSVRTSSAGLAIDEFAPRFHFQEHHDIVVTASPDRVFAAIKSVSADQIALFNVLTAIRRLGRPGPESILNAPNQQPILDVAVRTGFLLLFEQAPREVVLGTVVVAPPGTRHPSSFTGDSFKALVQPGFAKATMNFLVTDLGNGSSRVDTETRVFATDDVALGRFTTYWRIIFPGSSILRTTWLAAVKDRAERPTS
jgi:hypothetical protein